MHAPYMQNELYKYTGRRIRWKESGERRNVVRAPFRSRPPRGHVPSLAREIIVIKCRSRRFWHIFELLSLRSIDATPLSLRKVSPLVQPFVQSSWILSARALDSKEGKSTPLFAREKFNSFPPPSFVEYSPRFPRDPSHVPFPSFLSLFSSID